MISVEFVANSKSDHFVGRTDAQIHSISTAWRAVEQYPRVGSNRDG